MATKKRLDQLPAILSGDVGNNDLMYLVNENAQAETGYDSKKILVAEAAKKLLGGVELPTELPDFPANEQNALSALEYLNAKINDLYPVVTESGSLVTFTTPLALPLVSLKANITATQSGTGTPSPSNPRPISGFSSVTLTQKDSEDTTVDTFTIALGQTIFGGELDCKNGTATITHNIYTLDGEENWTIEDTHIFSANIFARKFGDDVQSVCDEMAFWGNGTTTQLKNGLSDGQFGFVRSNNRIWVCFDDCSTVDEIQAKTEGMTILYETQTSTELSGLTPDNFTTIQGENNIFADSGDVELSFKQGIQEYIDEQIATTQALIL